MKDDNDFGSLIGDNKPRLDLITPEKNFHDIKYFFGDVLDKEINTVIPQLIGKYKDDDT